MGDHGTIAPVFFDLNKLDASKSIMDYVLLGIRLYFIFTVKMHVSPIKQNPS